VNKKEKRFCLKQVLFVNSGEDNWTMVQHQIQDVSLSSTSAWMVGLDGTVYIQTQLSQARVSLCSSSSRKYCLSHFYLLKCGRTNRYNMYVFVDSKSCSDNLLRLLSEIRKSIWRFIRPHQLYCLTLNFKLFWLICFYRISAAFHVRVKEDPDLQSGRADRLLRPDRFCRH
jgi:hypothetical protein